MATTFEDLYPGRIIDLGTVTARREEMLDFARRYDPQPFHLDEEAARAFELGGLCASGWFTAALWMRVWVERFLLDSTSQGSPGGRELRWIAPVFPGDVLHCVAHVRSGRRSHSRRHLGLVDFDGRAERDTEPVMTFDFTAMFLTREAAGSPSDGRQ